MGYWEKERSADQGRPIELYDWFIGADHWRYNNSPQIVSYLANEYTNEIMTRGPIEYSTVFSDLANSSFEVTVPDTNQFANLFSDCPVDDDVYMNIYRGHDETDFISYFKGLVAGIRFAEDKAHVRIVSRMAKLLRNGGQVRFQRLCPLCLFRGRCGVNKLLYRITDDITLVSGLNITSDGFGAYSDQWFRGGWIECNGYKRMIVSHVANVVSITDKIPGILAGMSFVAYPGCNHTIQVCDVKYNNKLNYGGHRFLPRKNPLTGDPII